MESVPQGSHTLPISHIHTFFFPGSFFHCFRILVVPRSRNLTAVWLPFQSSASRKYKKPFFSIPRVRHGTLNP